MIGHARVLLLLVLLPALTPAQKQAKIYRDDLLAFFKEVEKSVPFFKTKGIDKTWNKRKKALLAAARKCRSESAFMDVVFDAVKELRDGHAAFTEVRPKPGDRPRPHWPGITLMPGKDEAVIVAATPRALQKKLPRGSTITKIDGKPARRFIEARAKEAWQEGGFFSSPQRARFFAYRFALRGERGDKHELEVRTGRKKSRVKVRADQAVSGWLHLYNPPDGLEKSARSVWHTEIEGNVGYVWLRRMDASAEEGVTKALAAHPNAKAWIVDLRGNTGGGYDRSFKKTIQGFGKSVAVIIDAGAISAAETFARDLKEVCKARLFGTRTAGSSSVKKTWTFPSGIATIRFSIRSRRGVGNRPIEFHGIDPDVVVETDPRDVAAGKNTEILAALAWLSN